MRKERSQTKPVTKSEKASKDEINTKIKQVTEEAVSQEDALSSAG